MSYFSLISNASFLVQLILMILFAFSIVSISKILLLTYRYRILRNSIKDFEDHFWSGTDLLELYQKITPKKRLSQIEEIFVSGFKEYSRYLDNPQLEKASVLDAVKSAMQVKQMQNASKLEEELPVLATIQSMSPYIGLFGTVFGIMQAFRELGGSQVATLSMVAPGIAEALIATAMGLVAAIPAGIAYNSFATKFNGLYTRYELFTQEFSNIINSKIYFHRV